MTRLVILIIIALLLAGFIVPTFDDPPAPQPLDTSDAFPF